MIDRWTSPEHWVAMIEYTHYNLIDFLQGPTFVEMSECFVFSSMLRFFSHKFPHVKTRQNTCCNRCSSANMYGNFQWPDKFAQTFVIFTPGFFFVLPTLTSFQSWCEILQSRIKSNSFVKIGRCISYLQKVMPVTSEWVFVIRNKFRVQIFRIDE